MTIVNPMVLAAHIVSVPHRETYAIPIDTAICHTQVLTQSDLTDDDFGRFRVSCVNRSFAGPVDLQDGVPT